MDENISKEQKTWQIYNFGKRNVFRLHLNESRHGVGRRGRGRPLHVDGPKKGTKEQKRRRNKTEQ